MPCVRDEGIGGGVKAGRRKGERGQGEQEVYRAKDGGLIWTPGAETERAPEQHGRDDRNRV